jgi:predicted nucleotidyltransferase
MGLPELQFKKVWKNRTITSFEGIKVSILGLKDLIKLKKKTGRKINGSDLKNLRYVLKTKHQRRK